MKVLFAIPKFVGDLDQYYELPLGILYIATNLKEHGHYVEILDLNKFESQPKALCDFLDNNPDFDVLCVGGLSAFFNSIEEIIAVTKQNYPRIVTVLGGGIVTSDKEAVCETFEPDFAVIGEGEETLLELINCLENNESFLDIKGIGYSARHLKKPHNNQQSYEIIGQTRVSSWHFTAARDPIDDIDAIPYPDFDLIDLEDYFRRQTPISSNYLYPLDFTRALPIITSRSCPLKCTFCFHPIGQKYRRKDLDKVFDEIEHMIDKYNITTLVVMDEMMSASKRRLVEFSERIKKYNLLWTCQLWTSSVDRKTLEVMKDSGCYLISYGLESINETVLKSMQKHGINKDNIAQAMKDTLEVGITIQGNFIFGDIAETVETSDETLAWWENHKQYHISLGRVAPYPGTPLYKIAIDKGLITDRINYTRRGTPSINLTEMTALEYQTLSSKIAIASTRGRQFAKITDVEVDARTPYLSYKFTATCPHCSNNVIYGNTYLKSASIFKLGCRSCAARFDVNPNVFPNIQEKLEGQRSQLNKYLSENRSFVISPCVMENIFIEYFELLGMDYNDFNIKYVLDSNHTRQGTKFLGKYSVVDRGPSHIDDWRGDVVIIMPTLYLKDIKNEFFDLGISEENIFSVNHG